MPLKPHPTDPDKMVFVSHRYDLQSHANEYERGFIDGMQKQMQSSVDKAVNAIGKREWVGLTDDDEIPWDGVDAKSFARAIEAKLKNKNGF